MRDRKSLTLAVLRVLVRLINEADDARRVFDSLGHRVEYVPPHTTCAINQLGYCRVRGKWPKFYRQYPSWAVA